MEANCVESTMEQINTFPTLPSPWNLEDLDNHLVNMIRWVAKEPCEVGKCVWTKEGAAVLNIACETLGNFRKKLEELEGESEDTKLEGVNEVLHYANDQYNKSVCEEEDKVKEQLWRRAFGGEQGEEGRDNEPVNKEQLKDGCRDERQTEEDHTLLGGEEGEQHESGSEDESGGGMRLRAVEEDAQGQSDEGFKEDAQSDQGFKEDAQGSGEGAKTACLTRRWLDMLFYDSEEDEDEGFEDEGEKEGLQLRVGEEDEWRESRQEAVEETDRGGKLEALHKDWEDWDEKGQRGGDTKKPWRFEEERGDSLTKGTGSFGEFQVDLRDAKAERDSSWRVQLGRRAAEESNEDLMGGVGKRVKSEIKKEFD